MKTVGQALAEARLGKNITLAEAERETKIRSELLRALERDDFSGLPSSTYIKGFITLYGEFLGLESDNLLALFRRQHDEKDDAPLQLLPDLSSKGTPKWTITPGRAFGFGIAILVLGFLGYLLAQYQSFAAAPGIEIQSPGDMTKVNNGTIQVVGRTDRDATLKINGQLVELTPSGAFSVSVTLPDGTDVLTFSATNKLGRITTVSRTVTVQTAHSTTALGPSTASSSALPVVAGVATSSASLVPQQPTFSKSLNLIIKNSGSDFVHIKVSADGTSYDGYIGGGGTSQAFSSNTQIVLQTSNAGSTDVSVNGIDEGVLGNSGQNMTKTYTPSSH